MNTLKNKIIGNEKIKGFLVLLLLILIGLFSNGYNSLNYPYYESDEGTYISQAWSISKDNALSPYTYWYDHPPFGWILISIWMSIMPGGYFTFGTSIDTARVLMLVIHIISLILVYFIVFRATKSKLAAFISGLLFTLSPLSIYFQRRVILDNIMTLFLLSSVAALYRTRAELKDFALSGLFYALAFLTKVTAVVFGPAILLYIVFKNFSVHKIFRIAAWLSVSILISSTFFMFAMFKGELLPSSLSSGDSEHVSLIGTVQFQMSRGAGLPFYVEGSDFEMMLQDWIERDRPFFYLLVAMFLIGSLLAFKNMDARFFALGSLLYILFLIRGGIVLNFYLVPLVSFLAILSGIVIGIFLNWLEKIKFENQFYRNMHLPKLAGVLIIVIIGVYFSFFATTKHLTVDEVSNQREAVNWIKHNMDPDAKIIIDSIMLVELRDPDYLNNKSFVNAEWFYKVSLDPSIRVGKYNDNWRNFDYVAITHEMLKQLEKMPDDDISKMAFVNTLPIEKWFANTTSFIDEQKFITTNGDWAMFSAVNGNTKSQLVDSWKYYRENFIHSYGQVIDPSNNNTTSEGQSYAMLRAVLMNDKETFKGVWLWTKHHLQHRLDDRLISWRWSNDRLIDSANATDADIDIALALLFAHKFWFEDEYLEDALEIINDIWRTSVVEVRGTLYLLPANKSQASRNDGYLLNPSYFSPAHYRIFAEVNPENDWIRLANDSYRVLNRIGAGNSTYLPANWYILNQNTGVFHSASHHIGPQSDLFGYDAFRVLWRVGLDKSWFNDPQSINYLQRASTFLSRQALNGSQATMYNPITGTPVSWESSLAMNVATLIALDNSPNKDSAISYYERAFSDSYNSEEWYWNNGRNYYDQNWAWFGSALFNNDLRNIWK